MTYPDINQTQLYMGINSISHNDQRIREIGTKLARYDLALSQGDYLDRMLRSTMLVDGKTDIADRLGYQTMQILGLGNPSPNMLNNPVNQERMMMQQMLAQALVNNYALCCRK